MVFEIDVFPRFVPDHGIVVEGMTSQPFAVDIGIETSEALVPSALGRETFVGTSGEDLNSKRCLDPDSITSSRLHLRTLTKKASCSSADQLRIIQGRRSKPT